MKYLYINKNKQILSGLQVRIEKKNLYIIFLDIASKEK